MTTNPSVLALEQLFAESRGEFPGLVSGPAAALAHLNNAAGSELPLRAITAMTEWLRSGFVNEGKVFRRLQATAELVGACRQATAELVGSDAKAVGFGANTTTNVYAISRALGRSWGPGRRVLLSEACHEAHVAPWLALRERGVEVELIPMRDDTHLDYEWLERHIDERVELVAIASSSNSTGTLHDARRVITLAHSVSALVSLDGAHYVPHAPVDLRELGADLFFFSLYKCFGPHLGAFVIRPELCARLEPFAIDMGSPVDAAARFEMGTRNHEAMAGWLGTLDYLEALGRRVATRARVEAPLDRAAALRHAMASICEWEAELTRHADERFAALGDALIWYRQPRTFAQPRLGVFSFNCRGFQPVEVARALESAGVEAVFGHHGGVRTLARLAPDFGGASIRMSLAHYNDRRDIDRAVDCVARLVGAERSVGGSAPAASEREHQGVRRDVERVTVVGAGLVGTVLASYLVRHGYEVDVHERQPDVRSHPARAGRSVHLVISARGWRVLDDLGVADRVRELCVALRGRRIHTEAGTIAFQPYGTDGQCIYAVNRDALNRLLLSHAAQLPGVRVHFGQRCLDVEPETGIMHVADTDGGARRTITVARPIFAADGAFSRVRRSLLDGVRSDHARRYLAHGYRELVIPPVSSSSSVHGDHWPLTPDAMHVWPRGQVMLSAFPNPDRSFTAMLVMPFEGETSFASLTEPAHVDALFDRLFADVRGLIPELADQVLRSTPSSLVTVSCAPWVKAGEMALVGDSAHAMVPFFGQGMNCGFEDCMVLSQLIEAHRGDWPQILARYDQLRRPNGDAISQMSLQNFVELSERVGDPRFRRRKALEQAIHRLHPRRFVPLYTMVAFSDLSYVEVQRRAEVQDRLLTTVMAQLDEQLGEALCERDVAEQLDHAGRMLRELIAEQVALLEPVDIHPPRAPASR